MQEGQAAPAVPGRRWWASWGAETVRIGLGMRLPDKERQSHLAMGCVESCDQSRQHIEKQRRYFVNKGPSSQGYGFSSSRVWK